ncbi:phage holin family protein [Microbacterium betulae]|uniref:Phage holin family protein n=1 Tax=Microbacterium betulae TaxID=2981139 RepID=A0AA97FF99_9MICO|nr:phage holin family protein [Microbacterium sp. AB]WOF22446.1 phage holin family protein [Microbacterium sp. AB]
MNQPGTPPEQSTAELISQLSAQTSRLVRDEMRLVQAEFAAKTKQGGLGVGLLGAGGILAWFGLGALVATAIVALSLLVPAWAAGLIVTAILFIAAGIAAMLGKKKVESLSPAPERTITNVKRDIAEVKEHSHHDNA